jgi:hypothetical protein
MDRDLYLEKLADTFSTEYDKLSDGDKEKVWLQVTDENNNINSTLVAKWLKLQTGGYVPREKLMGIFGEQCYFPIEDEKRANEEFNKRYENTNINLMDL